MMHSKLAAGLFLASLATVFAAPPLEPRGGKTVKLDQVDIGKRWRNGAVAVKQTYEKFGVTVPEDVKTAAAAAQKGKVKATPEQYDSEYLCPVTVGAQQLMLDFDTGSSDLWVFSTLQPAAQRQGHTAYNVNHGTRSAGETWSIEYEDGSGSKGVVYSDKVVVGGVTATKQAVEAATSVSSTFKSDKKDDGLLGLAFQSLNTCRPKLCTTFFNSVEPTLASPVFTAALKHAAPGAYTFGYIDSSLHSGPISYVPVRTTRGLWEFTAGGYSVGSSTSTKGSIGDAIADTGTTLFYLPKAVAKAYWSKVSGASYNSQAGGYIFPCSEGNSLPNFHVKIGSGTFTVPGPYMNFAPANEAGTICFGGIQPNTGLPFSVFGDVFLKSVYAVFEPKTPRIGFAKK